MYITYFMAYHLCVDSSALGELDLCFKSNSAHHGNLNMTSMNIIYSRRHSGNQGSKIGSMYLTTNLDYNYSFHRP